MKTKNKIGALVVLGGIAVLGYVYFKKNKPTVASTQLKKLEELSNSYKTGGDESYIKPITTCNQNEMIIDGFCQNLFSPVQIRWTQKEIDEMKNFKLPTIEEIEKAMKANLNNFK